MNRIVNTSRFDTAKLEEMISFIEKICPGSKAARFEVMNQTKAQARSSGQATMRRKTWAKLSHPGLIELWIGPSWAPYPYADDFMVNIFGRCEVKTWEEDVFLVLAHEMMHIRDFFDEELFPLIRGNDFALEVRAEGFAQNALQRWRKRRQQTRKAA